MRYGGWTALAAMVAITVATPAAASNCGGSPCTARKTVKGNSVFPTPDEFTRRGDLFSDRFTEATLASNGSQRVDLGFNVNFGFGNVDTLFVNENGIVSFQRPLGTISASPIQMRAVTPGGGGFQPVRSLADFGIPVIAPFYADLTQGSAVVDGRLTPGDITVQFGAADPYDNGGAYSLRDARSAVRITWYGLTSVAADAPVYAQLLLSSDVGGLSNFEFRYGPLPSPGQEGYGSIAGFSLGGNLVQFSGPYRDGTPTFFEFQDGRLLNGGGIPEPDQWLLMIVGFGLIAAAMRFSRTRRQRDALTA